MVVQHNLTAMNSNRMLNITVKSQAKSTEKLSSGYRINRAADDAAGLSISEKMRKQIRGLTQASANAQDGISMVQTADGALEEVHAMLQRANELAVKAANGTLSDDDRNYIKNEIDQLNTEIDRVRTTSKFNETYLFPETGSAMAGPNGNLRAQAVYHIEYNVANNEANVIGGEVNDPAISYVDTNGSPQTPTILAQKLAEELIPNAIKQIVTTFPELDPGTPISIDVAVGTIDGKGSTLAVASCMIGSTAHDFTVTVDVDDFTDADAQGTGPNAAELESTIGHELMHTFMQNKFPQGMKTSFPKWFKEGMAQLSGGGFETGWNEWLAGKTESQIEAQLKDPKHSIDERVYGTGYLFSAYLAFLQHGGDPTNPGTITQADLVDGARKIFAAMNSDLAQDIMNHTIGGRKVSEIKALWDSHDATELAKAAKFIKAFTDAVDPANGGAGALIASGGLSAGGTNILGNTPNLDATNPVQINKVSTLPRGDVSKMVGGYLNLHVGADATSNNQIQVMLYNISSEALGTAAADFSSQDGARQSIDIFAIAIQRVSAIRSYYGAIQNRLEHTINNLDNVVENTTAAESAIRDTDMATEMVRYSNNNILAQAGQAMLAQSNQSNQGVLSLLQ